MNGYVCGTYPDGYVDSYGQFTVTVTPAGLLSDGAVGTGTIVGGV